ncbi:MAG: SCO family protein [Pseudomonadota bacterium]
MSVGVRNTLVGIAGFIALILGLFFYSFFSTRGLSEEQYAALGFYRFENPRLIEDFSLLDQDGTPVNIDNLKGQWSLLFFGFTFCPDICPTTMGVLARAVEKLDVDPQVVMVSVDPERDSPAQLKQYVPAFNPAFIGYTGEFDQIVKLATQVNIAFGKVPGPTAGSYLVDHSASIVVINPDGRYAGFIKTPHSEANIATIMQSLM